MCSISFENFDAYLDRIDPHPVSPTMAKLFAAGDRIWQENKHDFHYRDYVAADHERVFQALAVLKERAVTFLEWGAGLGIITSTAALLGYEAFGIEIDPKLCRQAEELAEAFGARADFSYGSFVPDAYEASDEYEREFFRTVMDEHDGYAEIDMELRDFDLIYAYPWPGERDFFLDVARQCGRRGALLMTYDVREGIFVEQL